MKEIKGEGPPKYNEDHLKILLANSDPIRYSVLYLIRYSVLYVIRYSFATWKCGESHRRDLYDYNKP